MIKGNNIQAWFTAKLTPEHLLSKYQQTGKNKYLSCLVTEFNASLYHYLLSQSDQYVAEDVLQTVWLKVMKASGNNSATHVKSWLFTIARNTLIDELRRQNKWQNECLDENKLLSDSLEHSLQTSDRLTQFNHAIAQLPYLQREAFIFQQEGFSVEEIAQLCHESFETVKSRLRYARNNLRNLLGKPS